MTIQINDGSTFIKGRSSEVAAELLAKAAELGIDQNLVRTTSHGYIVPSELVEATEEEESTEETKVAEEAAGDRDEKAEADPEKDAEVENLFDPSAHTAAEVNAYIAAVDADERARVLAAEAEGKNRATVRDNTNTEGAK